ncbi:thiazolylpeptide-type bacteriocin [Streptomyces sp. CAU 1734]|uniref:thiazolylpeptide-type bacteriocin n=1 Tax=Streptomyces sp. CAU 1734 TaxID=3140360 RepID=UPI003261AC94
MAHTDMEIAFDLQDLDLGDITVTSMRDTVGFDGGPITSPSSTSCSVCSNCVTCSGPRPVGLAEAV